VSNTKSEERKVMVMAGRNLCVLRKA